MTNKWQQPSLVTGHEVIGLRRLRQGEEKIIRWIGRALHARQRIDILGELLDLVDQPAGLVGLDQLGDPGLVQRGPQLVELCVAGQQREFARQKTLAAKGISGGARSAQVPLCAAKEASVNAKRDRNSLSR